jgi:hypothetical protein
MVAPTPPPAEKEKLLRHQDLALLRAFEPKSSVKQSIQSSVAYIRPSFSQYPLFTLYCQGACLWKSNTLSACKQSASHTLIRSQKPGMASRAHHAAITSTAWLPTRRTRCSVHPIHMQCKREEKRRDNKRNVVRGPDLVEARMFDPWGPSTSARTRWAQPRPTAWASVQRRLKARAATGAGMGADLLASPPQGPCPRAPASAPLSPDPSRRQGWAWADPPLQGWASAGSTRPWPSSARSVREGAATPPCGGGEWRRRGGRGPSGVD